MPVLSLILNLEKWPGTRVGIEFCHRRQSYKTTSYNWKQQNG